MEAVLEVEGLTVYRGAYAAVREVSFRLQPGTVTAIIGPNGAGKSTLVQAVLGILPWQEGRISILGQSLEPSGRLPARVRQNIAYLPQSFQFDRSIPMTVAELVALGWGKPGLSLPWAGRRDRQRAVSQALAQVSGNHLIHRPIGNLSGGETKRVLLAYCLVRPRKLLILDEASAGLDVPGESEFYRLLNQFMSEHGWTILQISHDLDMVGRHCHQVLCLNRSLICQGSPELALSSENLMAAYGPDFTRYRHRH